MREEDVPTEQPQAEQDPRIPHPHAHDRRPERAQATPAQRPQENLGIGKGPSKRRFDKIFTEGKRVQGRLLRLSAIPGEGLVGFATAKKIGSHARRNQARRRGQSAFREIAYQFAKPLDLVIIIGTAACDVEFAEVKEELGALLEKIESRWAGDSECS
jgi:ribonuclease P protein component